MKDDDRSHIAAQLASKTWAELEVIEAQIGEHKEGRLLFPDNLFKRAPDGKWRQIPVRFMPLRTAEEREARLMARRIAAEEELDPKLDPGEFDNLDTLCRLWKALREPTAPYEPVAMDPRDLERRFDKGAIAHAWAQYAFWASQVDPRPTDLDEGELVAVIAAIAERRDIRPLLAFDGQSQTSCIIGMATMLAPFLRSQSLSAQSERSTPAS